MIIIIIIIIFIIIIIMDNKNNINNNCKPLFLPQKGLGLAFRRLKVSPSEGSNTLLAPLTISLYLCFRKTASSHPSLRKQELC